MEGGAENAVRVEKKDGFAILHLNRPEVRNAISFGLMKRLVEALRELDCDDSISVAVIAGDERAFSGGADVKEMSGQSLASFTKGNPFSVWDELQTIGKPVIAAVEGYALGGGCELAMASDMIVASEDAVFGQPEINLGIMPGAGGTQRLTRAAGKQLAMRYVLTGEHFTAREAEKMGLLSSLVPRGQALAEATRIAKLIASKPRLAVLHAKKAVREAAEGGIMEGIWFERALFYSLFATLDQKEGMDAFLKKRKPDFSGK